MSSHAEGLTLLNEAAERIIVRHLIAHGASRAEVVQRTGGVHGHGVDIVAIEGRVSSRIKVKADPYFGLDAHKIDNRDLVFYRADAGSFAFEAVANSATRELGWCLSSDAEELYYYYLTLGQTADEVRALLREPDEVFFSELGVERDELVVLSMPRVRAWCEEHIQDYAPRPVTLSGVASWYRLIPRSDIEHASVPVRSAGAIFSALVP